MAGNSSSKEAGSVFVQLEGHEQNGKAVHWWN